MTAATRQAARREREREKNRIGRLLYLSDEEFEALKELLATFREMAPGQVLKLEVRR